MRIDIRKEQLRTLEQAAHSFPGGAAPSTIWRWHRRGVRGVRLETVVIGGKRFTSVEALERFAEASTAAREPASLDTAPPERDEATQGKLRAVGLL